MKKKITDKKINIIFIATVFVIVVISLCAFMNSPAVGASGGIEWQSHEKGLSMSKKQNKDVFIYFHAEWCGYCRKMEMSTFQNKALIDYLNANFIAIKVDSDVERKVAEPYSIRGLPTCWFLNSQGHKLSSVPGYIDEKKLLLILKYVHTKSYETMSFRDFQKSL